MADEEAPVALFNPQEGIRGKREGGPFLDEVEREREAAAYNRPVSQTIGLVPAEQLVDNVYSNPSHAVKPGLDHAVALGVAAVADDPDTLANSMPEEKVPVPHPDVINDEAEKEARELAEKEGEQESHPVAPTDGTGPLVTETHGSKEGDETKTSEELEAELEAETETKPAKKSASSKVK